MLLATRLVAIVLTHDPRQRIRLAQAGLAMLLMAGCVASMHVGVALGIVDGGRALDVWTALSIAGFVIVGVLIRTGAAARFADPSLAVFQMAFSIACAAWGYAIAGSAHVVAPIMLAVILMFGMFGMTTRQVVGVAVYATVLFGAVMAWKTRDDPARYVASSDLLVFLVMLTMIAGVVILSTRLHRMRDRLRERTDALEVALAHIQRLATHDELTGLVNRRHMQAMLEGERDRSQRDGHAWCIALLDLDHFKRLNDAHGHACGDEALRALGHRTAALIRKTDALGRWGGEEFVLLLPATTLDAAHRSVDRVREHFHQHAFQVDTLSLTLSFSAGVTEHRPGETVAQTLERADRLMYRAKEQGRNRVEAG
jgi:diguanylate cyclase (GGDEF)-like protein